MVRVSLPLLLSSCSAGAVSGLTRAVSLGLGLFGELGGFQRTGGAIDGDGDDETKETKGGAAGSAGSSPVLQAQPVERKRVTGLSLLTAGAAGSSSASSPVAGRDRSQPLRGAGAGASAGHVSADSSPLLGLGERKRASSSASLGVASGSAEDSPELTSFGLGAGLGLGGTSASAGAASAPMQPLSLGARLLPLMSDVLSAERKDGELVLPEVGCCLLLLSLAFCVLRACSCCAVHCAADLRSHDQGQAPQRGHPASLHEEVNRQTPCCSPIASSTLSLI